MNIFIIMMIPPDSLAVLVGAGLPHPDRLLVHVVGLPVPVGHGRGLLSALEERQKVNI